jgi:Brp/Blh family beta-carotene 15,15'-monooxygenase
LLALIAALSLMPEILQVIALIGIFSFGILHGSNDLFVLQSLKQKDQQNDFWKALFTYLGVVLGFVVVFYVVPLFALIAFIVISAYHFGEQHFHLQLSDQDSVLASVFYFVYGLMVLFLLFYFNSPEVISIISDMTGYLVPQPAFEIVLIASGISSIVFYFLLSKTNPKLKHSALANIIYIVLFSVLFLVSNVVWGFATYFVLWHSLPSLRDQVNSLYGRFNFKNFKHYFKKAFPYWLASIIGMAVLVYLFMDTKNFLSLLFAFIAAITFPHVFVMRRLFDKN